MQQCPTCLKVYDESEYSRCPYCDGLLDDDFDDEDDEDDEDDFEIDETLQKFIKIVNSPGVFNNDGEYERCPICGHGLHYYNGTKTCPECDSV